MNNDYDWEIQLELEKVEKLRKKNSKLRRVLNLALDHIIYDTPKGELEYYLEKRIKHDSRKRKK